MSAQYHASFSIPSTDLGVRIYLRQGLKAKLRSASSIIFPFVYSRAVILKPLISAISVISFLS